MSMRRFPQRRAEAYGMCQVCEDILKHFGKGKGPDGHLLRDTHLHVCILYLETMINMANSRLQAYIPVSHSCIRFLDSDVSASEFPRPAEGGSNNEQRTPRSCSTFA